MARPNARASREAVLLYICILSIFTSINAQTVPYCAGTRLGVIEWARVLYSINLPTVCIYKTKLSVEIYITINNGTFARPEESNAIISEPPLNSRGPNIIPQGLKASG